MAELGPSQRQNLRPHLLTTATTANEEGDSDDSDSEEGDYGNEQIEVDNEVYYDESE